MKRNLLYLEIAVKGNNVKYLLGYLQNKNVDIYECKVSEEKVKITIDYNDRRKFFAICKNMCYNTISVKYKGVLSPFIIAFKNIGLIIGIVLFIFSVINFNDYILSVDVGDNYYESEIISVSKDYGVDKFKRFSKADIVGLKNKLLSLNPDVSFISIEKCGNILKINVVNGSNQEEVLNQNVKDLVSPVNGVVDSVNVLRGTPLVEVGQRVDVGTPLIGAYTLGKEDKVFPTYIVGRIAIKEEKVKFYKTLYINDDVIKTVETIARFNENDEVIDIKSTVKGDGVEVLITVRHIIVGG